MTDKKCTAVAAVLRLVIVLCWSTSASLSFTFPPSTAKPAATPIALLHNSCAGEDYFRKAETSRRCRRRRHNTHVMVQTTHKEQGNDHRDHALMLEELSSKTKDVALSVMVATCLFAGMFASNPTPVLADELGKETEAPTLFTGENVMICTKRGPLGACLKTEVRTQENDNDKATKYFRAPEGEDVKDRDLAMRQATSEVEGIDLVKRLRQQSEDNKVKNEKIIAQKTFENDQSATFGPFDRELFIKNADGEGFTILENPQAMRLKKAGYIEGRRFVKQPTQEVMDDALVGPSLADTIKGFFGGADGDSSGAD